MTTGTKLSRILWVGLFAGCTVEMADGEGEMRGETAEQHDELSRSALSKRQEATVLKLIDDICGDTWCEGDHNFSFDELDCRKGCRGQAGSCEMTFRVFSYDTDIETGPTHTRSCRTAGFAGFDSLVDTHAGYQSLSAAFYDTLTSCISQVEDELPR